MKTISKLKTIKEWQDFYEGDSIVGKFIHSLLGEEIFKEKELLSVAPPSEYIKTTINTEINFLGAHDVDENGNGTPEIYNGWLLGAFLDSENTIESHQKEPFFDFGVFGDSYVKDNFKKYLDNPNKKNIFVYYDNFGSLDPDYDNDGLTIYALYNDEIPGMSFAFYMGPVN
jgi:hypothetical protein